MSGAKPTRTLSQVFNFIVEDRRPGKETTYLPSVPSNGDPPRRGADDNGERIIGDGNAVPAPKSSSKSPDFESAYEYTPAKPPKSKPSRSKPSRSKPKINPDYEDEYDYSYSSTTPASGYDEEETEYDYDYSPSSKPSKPSRAKPSRAKPSRAKPSQSKPSPEEDYDYDYTPSGAVPSSSSSGAAAELEAEYELLSKNYKNAKANDDIKGALDYKKQMKNFPAKIAKVLKQTRKDYNSAKKSDNLQLAKSLKQKIVELEQFQSSF